MKSTESNRKSIGRSAARMSVENGESADTVDLQDHIATAAYYKAQARGFTPGLEIDDWLEAEVELNKSDGF